MTLQTAMQQTLVAEIARMEAVVVPECDCLRTWRGAGFHRPGCQRLLALYEKYRPAHERPTWPARFECDCVHRVSDCSPDGFHCPTHPDAHAVAFLDS